MSTVAERYEAGGDDAGPGRARTGRRRLREQPVEPYAADPYAPADPYGPADPYVPADRYDGVDPYGAEPGGVDPYGRAAPDPDGTGPGERNGYDGYDVAEPISGAVVAQHRTLPHGERRADFGAHLETHYPRLVAQLYAITLHPGDAHEAVQEAYSRAWRRWSEVSESGDAVGWVRRVAVRASARGWRQGLTRIGLRSGGRPAAGAVEPRTDALLDALARLPVRDRRVVVLHHMAGLPVAEVADLERIPEKTVHERLRRSRHVVSAGLAEVLDEVVGGVPGSPGGEWNPAQWDARDLRGESG